MLFTYEAEVIRVIDGDSLVLFVDQGLREYHKGKFRLTGINAPDHEDPEGKKRSTAALRRKLPKGLKVIVKTDMDKTEKYGSWLATIFITGREPSVNQWMLDKGYAKPYDGKGPRPRSFND